MSAPAVSLPVYLPYTPVRWVLLNAAAHNTQHALPVTNVMQQRSQLNHFQIFHALNTVDESVRAVITRLATCRTSAFAMCKATLRTRSMCAKSCDASLSASASRTKASVCRSPVRSSTQPAIATNAAHLFHKRQSLLFRFAALGCGSCFSHGVGASPMLWMACRAREVAHAVIVSSPGDLKLCDT